MMAEAAALFFACAALGILLGRGWDAAAIAVALVALTAVAGLAP